MIHDPDIVWCEFQVRTYTDEEPLCDEGWRSLLDRCQEASMADELRDIEQDISDASEDHLATAADAFMLAHTDNCDFIPDPRAPYGWISAPAYRPARGYFFAQAPSCIRWTVNDECELVAIIDEDDDEPVVDPPDPPKCHECKGEGWVTLFSTRERCERCDGSGY